MSNIPEYSKKDKALYYKLTNQAKNGEQQVREGFINLAIALKEILDTEIYKVEYKTFDEWVKNHLDIDVKTAYDIAKIGRFQLEHVKVLPKEKASNLGLKKMKLLTQKLSKFDLKIQEAFLSQIEENETYSKIEFKINGFMMLYKNKDK